MKAGAHPALAQGKVRYVGDHVAVVIADTYAQARDAAEKIDVDYRRTAGGRRYRRRRPSPASRNPRRRAEQHGLQLASRRQGGDRRGLRRRGACDEARPRQQPPDPERDGAARGGRRLRLRAPTRSRSTRRARTRMSRGSCSRRSSASRPSTSCASSRRTSAAASARRSSSTPRRPSAPGRPRRSTGRSNGPRSARKSFLSDAHGRDHVTHAELALDASGKITGLRVHTIANLGAYLSTFASSVPTYLYAPLLSGQYDIPAIYCRGRRGLHQHGAGRRLSRRRPAGGDVRRRAPRRSGRARDRARSGRVPPPEFRHVVPASDAGHHDLRRRRLRGGARQGAGARRLQGRRRAQGGLGRQGQAARRRLLRLYRGLRPCALRGGRLARRAASGFGNRRKCGSIRSARSRF